MLRDFIIRRQLDRVLQIGGKATHDREPEQQQSQLPTRKEAQWVAAPQMHRFVREDRAEFLFRQPLVRFPDANRSDSGIPSQPGAAHTRHSIRSGTVSSLVGVAISQDGTVKSTRKKHYAIECYAPHEISAELLQDMEAFVQSIDPSLPANHIANNHLNWLDLELYIVFDDANICALFSYSAGFVRHPLTNRRVFISVGGLSYKQKGTEVKNLTKAISMRHMKRHLGSLWFLREFIAVAKTVNPRIFVQFFSFFPKLHPSGSAKDNSAWQDFLSTHLSRIERHPVILNEHLVEEGKPIFDSKLDVTSSFDLHYKSRNDTINTYFFDHGIFVSEGEQIFLTNLSLAVVGEYRFSALVAKNTRAMLEKFRAPMAVS